MDIPRSFDWLEPRLALSPVPGIVQPMPSQTTQNLRVAPDDPTPPPKPEPDPGDFPGDDRPVPYPTLPPSGPAGPG